MTTMITMITTSIINTKDTRIMIRIINNKRKFQVRTMKGDIVMNKIWLYKYAILLSSIGHLKSYHCPKYIANSIKF